MDEEDIGDGELAEGGFSELSWLRRNGRKRNDIWKACVKISKSETLRIKVSKSDRMRSELSLLKSKRSQSCENTRDGRTISARVDKTTGCF